MFTTIQTKDGPVGCHLNTVKPARVVPGPQRHNWSHTPKRGEVATCVKCGCKKIYQNDWQILYRLKGHSETTVHRPACGVSEIDAK